MNQSQTSFKSAKLQYLSGTSLMSQKLRMESLAPQKNISTPVQKTESIKKPAVPDVSSVVIKDNDIETKIDLLQKMFTKFLETSQQDI